MWVVMKPLRDEADLLGSPSFLGEVTFCGNQSSSHGNLSSHEINLFLILSLLSESFPGFLFGNAVLFSDEKVGEWSRKEAINDSCETNSLL